MHPPSCQLRYLTCAQHKHERTHTITSENTHTHTDMTQSNIYRLVVFFFFRCFQIATANNRTQANEFITSACKTCTCTPVSRNAVDKIIRRDNDNVACTYVHMRNINIGTPPNDCRDVHYYCFWTISIFLCVSLRLLILIHLAPIQTHDHAQTTS